MKSRPIDYGQRYDHDDESAGDGTGYFAFGGRSFGECRGRYRSGGECSWRPLC